MGDTVKDHPLFPEKFDGSSLRIAIVHARWNKSVIDALIAGAVRKIKESGVKDHNIVIQSVPGSFELPLACQRVIAGSHIQAGATATDLLGAFQIGTPRSATPVAGGGATMHFEYIAESVSQALMRVQLDTGVPVIFGVLTALTEEQALERAGIGRVKVGHNHGEDWGAAAVEMASRTRRWGEGKF
ncbi:Lumazine synthase [Russula brevipes]|nr:Lumazine synthase [Russula brevipes]